MRHELSDRGHLQAALRVIVQLIERPQRSTAEDAYLGALTDLVETYEAARVVIPPIRGVDALPLSRGGKRAGSGRPGTAVWNGIGDIRGLVWQAAPGACPYHAAGKAFRRAHRCVHRPFSGITTSHRNGPRLLPSSVSGGVVDVDHSAVASGVLIRSRCSSARCRPMGWKSVASQFLQGPALNLLRTRHAACHIRRRLPRFMPRASRRQVCRPVRPRTACRTAYSREANGFVVCVVAARRANQTTRATARSARVGLRRVCSRGRIWLRTCPLRWSSLAPGWSGWRSQRS